MPSPSVSIPWVNAFNKKLFLTETKQLRFEKVQVKWFPSNIFNQKLCGPKYLLFCLFNFHKNTLEKKRKTH